MIISLESFFVKRTFFLWKFRFCPETVFVQCCHQQDATFCKSQIVLPGYQLASISVTHIPCDLGSSQRTYSGFISSIDIFKSIHKIYWENEFIYFSGYPFIIAGQKWLDPHHDKDRNIRSKEKQKENKNIASVS